MVGTGAQCLFGSPISRKAVRAAVRGGIVIPAHPLALTPERRLDARRQRALSRYYIDAGAGGLAVGVHTTQFAIREAGLYEPVLTLARRARRSGPTSRWRWSRASSARPRRRCARPISRSVSAITPGS